jgi:hypothetical protein
MGILEKLRPQPRWKHADPGVRVAAVYELGPDESEVLHALAREDAEARVRRAAVTRIDEVSVLAEIAGADPDEDVRAEAVRGLAGVAAEADDLAQASEAVRQLVGLGRIKEIVLVARDSSSPDIRTLVVDVLGDQKALASLSRHARDGATRLRALARLTDVEEILNVALKAEHTDAAVAALERVADSESLTAVSQRAQNKVAARRARTRLRALEEAAQPIPPDSGVRLTAEDRQRAVALVNRAESLVAVADPDEAGAALSAARLAWAELQADIDIESALVGQFEAASEAVREAIAERYGERAAEEERARALAREQADRLTICDQIADLSGDEAPDRVAELKVRWDSLPPMPSEYAASLTRRFQDACRQFEDRERRRVLAQAAAARLETLATELEQLAASDQGADEIIARWRGLRRDADVLREHAPANPAAAERVEHAVARLEQKEHEHQHARSRQEQENLRRLQQLCRQMEALAAGQLTLKAGERALRDIRAAFDAHVPLPSKKDRQEIQARLEAARSTLGPRVEELRDADDWQRWANLQVQEELCRGMEALKGEADLEIAARRMRELQSRWKQVALAPRAQGEATWRRFKKAQDDVFARTAAHFAAQNQERAANLARKQALSERAEALADSTDWVKTAIEIQGLQAEWKTIGPVTRGHERAIWERFRAACDRFFTRRQEDLKQRKELWAANLARKEALCVRAEEAADSTDWDATAAEMRRLQAEWKTIGPVRKSKSDAVWQRFRGACDRFFERYKHRDQVELASKAAPRDAVIRQLESLAPAAGTEAGPAPDGLQAVVQDARMQWQKAPELPRQIQNDLAVRYHEALSRLVAAWPEAFKGTDLDPETTRKQMEKLVAKVEEFAPPAGRQAPLSPAERLAQQWRERLAANTMGGRSTEHDEGHWLAAEQEIRSAQAQWMRLGPVPADLAGPLNERFQRACRRFYDQRKKAS